jgi:hypothetical protein
MTATVRPVDELQEDPLTLKMFAALDHGAPSLPAALPMGLEVIAAAGVWGDYGSVVTLWRDDDDDQTLTNGVYLLARTPDGRWQAPGSRPGSGLPEWVLDRPDGPLPGRKASDLVSLGAQLACVAGRWIAELTVMAGRAVTTVEVCYDGDTITVAVPASGLVTLPAVIRSAADGAEFRGFDDAGRLRAVLRYWPLDEDDRKAGWPNASLWGQEELR